MNWRGLFDKGPRAASQLRLRGPSAMFWAVNIALLAAIYLVILQPLRDAVAAGEDALADRRATLARYEAVVGQAAAIDDYAKQVAASNARGEFIPGENDGIVAANLQARLKAAADDAKIAVRSLQMLPSKTSQGVALVGARLEVTGSVAAVHALARSIESGTPLLFVTDADLRSQSLFWGGASDKEAEIEAQFDVFGVAAPRAAP
jgi:general secretion pathway protein M